MSGVLIERAAVFTGADAALLAYLFTRYCSEAIADADPALRRRIEGCIEALRLAGSSASGTCRCHSAEATPCSAREQDDISTAEAAGMLGVTGRRVRALAVAGIITGHKDAGHWRVSSRSVDAYVKRKR